MLRIVLAIAILFSTNLIAQDSFEVEVKKTIETFFEGFHKGDTILMKSVLMDKIVVQTAFTNKEGKDILVDEGGAGKMLKAIGSRAADQKWDERLLDFVIKVDGNMANAWTPYEFWFNDTFSHCGVNSFQLFHDNGKWKIIYLIDTRRRTGCGKE